MLRKRQILFLILLAGALWTLVTLNIRFRPEAIADPTQALVSFILSPLAGLLSVFLCKVVGRLAPSQLLSGVMLVGAVAMMLDGAVLNWLPGVYGCDERILRLAAAYLLWGYGVAFAVALIWAARAQRRSDG